MPPIPHYLNAFSNLRPNRNRRLFPASTLHAAPHKPFLLLAVMDLIASGVIRENRIEPDQDLVDGFLAYWDEILGPIRPVSIGLPFHHLQSQGFWHPVPKPDGPRSAPSTAGQLRRTYSHAYLDQDLFDLLVLPGSREELRNIIIQTSFAPDTRPLLWNLATTSVDSLRYSQLLLASQDSGSFESEKAAPAGPVRDQGFRRAVVRVYENRCALCGIRMITPDGHTVVDAAHIMDWAISHNDHPSNGFALCKLCHWSFDKGLVAVGGTYEVMVSRAVREEPNLPGHIASFQGRHLILPTAQAMFPAKENLQWHRKEKFLG